MLLDGFDMPFDGLVVSMFVDFDDILGFINILMLSIIGSCIRFSRY